MTPELLWTPRSKRDLADIYEWILADRPVTAESVYRALTTQAQLLCHHPFLGKVYPELGAGLRVITVAPYLLIYRPVLDSANSLRRVEVIRILHGSRLIVPLFRR